MKAFGIALVVLLTDGSSHFGKSAFQALKDEKDSLLGHQGGKLDSQKGTTAVKVECNRLVF